jgi:hypothetical protein
MIATLLLAPALAFVAPAAPVLASDPAVERSGEPQLQTQTTRRRDRAKPAPTPPCAGCAAPPSAHPPMLDTPVPGLLLIPAEAAAG